MVLARGTPGFSGADLQNMVNMAAVQASREGAKAVDLKHFEWAKVRYGNSHGTLSDYRALGPHRHGQRAKDCLYQ